MSAAGRSTGGPLGRDTDPTRYPQTVKYPDFDRAGASRAQLAGKWYGVSSGAKRRSSTRAADDKSQTLRVEVPPSLRLWFVVHAAVDLVAAVPLLVAPVPVLQRLGWTCIDPIAVRLVNPNGTEEAPTAALLLAESPAEPATLVMSPRAFVLNRIMRCDEPGPIQKFRLLDIVQRGGDFERVAFEHVDPSF